MAVLTGSQSATRPTTFFFEPLLSGGAKFLIHAALIIIGFIYVYPFIWTFGSAFKTNQEFFNMGLTAFPPRELSMENFVKAWEIAKFSRYFFNTVFVSVMTSVSVVLLTSMAAFALARIKVPGTKFILGALALTFFLPRGYTILPTFQIVRGLGLLNTLWAVVLVSTAGGMIFNTLLFYGYMRTIPDEIEEAAIMDGASALQRYYRIALPLSGPIIVTVGLFTFMGAWNDFFTPLVFTIARPELQTLSVGMFTFIGETSRDWTALCAGATISIMPILVIYAFMQRYFIEGFAGAVKQ